MDAAHHDAVSFDLPEGHSQHLPADAAEPLPQPREAQLVRLSSASITGRVLLSAMRSSISCASASVGEG
jgi:hypothetical protein